MEDSHHALSTLNNRIVQRLGFHQFDVEVKQGMKAAGYTRYAQVEIEGSTPSSKLRATSFVQR